MTGRSLHVAVSLLLVLGTIRGGATSVAKYVSTSGVPALGYAFWQSALAASLLLLIRHRRISKTPEYLGQWHVYLVCGLLGTALPNVLFFVVVKHIPAGYMAVILTTVPLITYGFVLILGMERLDLIRALGIGVGFGGALLIASASFTDGLRVDGFVLLAFLCPAGYSIAGIYVGRSSVKGSDPLLLAAGTQTVAAAFLLPAALISGQFHPIWSSPALPEALILLHGAIAAIAYALFFRIVHLAGPVFYSQSAYVIAVTGIGWGMVVFGERHGGAFWIAAGLILGGLTLVNLRQPARVRVNL